MSVDEFVAAQLTDLSQPDERAMSAVRARADDILRPRGAFHRLDEIAVWLAGWQRTSTPHVERAAALVFVASHGVAGAGVSAYPASVTASMRDALRSGVATASVLARMAEADIRVVDVGVGAPTGDLRVEPALSADRFRTCFEAGRSAVAELDTDLLVLGEMGIGNTTAAACVCHSLFGLTAEDWTGRGTGLDDEGLDRKVTVVRQACSRDFERRPMEILRQVGGAELVAIAGAAVEARRLSIPVLLDGFVVTAALAPLEVASPGALDHVLAAHTSPEPGHRMVLEKLAKEPLLDLGLRLGEGSGALLAVPLVRAAVAGVTDVATFDEWGAEGRT